LMFSFLCGAGCAMSEEPEKRWCVVGGADKGGILVRTGQELTSSEAEKRLSHGALVKQVKLVGERLQFERLTGTGPETGWVSLKVKDKALMEPAPVLDPKAVEEGRSVKAFADPPRPVEGRKLRILCLHGTASTEKVLRAQLAPLIKRASDDIEFVLQDGCVDCDLRNPIVAKQVELMKQYFPEEKFKQWAEPLGEETGWRRYGGWERAIEFAQEAMTKHAPIDGLLGFSQGSNLSHPLGAQAALGQGHPLHCVVHFCTTKPGWVGQTPDLFEYQLPLPALIIEGKVDETAKGSDEVASTYEHPVRLSHSDGHRPFPKKPDEAKKLAEDIHSFVVKSCRGTQL